MDDDVRTATDDATPAPHQPRRVLPRLAAAGVAAALASGGASIAAVAASGPSSPTDVVAIVDAWPKKYTGVGLSVEASKLIKVEETGASLPEG